jgi:hypothetical protein
LSEVDLLVVENRNYFRLMESRDVQVSYYARSRA